MKNLYMLLLMKAIVLASFINNPHDINITDKDINNEICKNCHLLFIGEYSGYFAANYNFSIDDIVTAGTDAEISEGRYGDASPITSSALCFSCHDGIIAKSVNHKTTLRIGLENNHPISIEYIEGISGLSPKNTKIYNWDNASSINDILVNEKVECISCHNPHNKTNINYLRRTNTKSEMCFTCHNK